MDEWIGSLLSWFFSMLAVCFFALKLILCLSQAMLDEGEEDELKAAEMKPL